MRSRRLSQLLVGCTLAACSSLHKTDQQDRTPTPERSAIVVRGEDMSGSLLQTMQTRIPSMRVSTTSGPCPQIVFRGELSVRNPSNPSVYIDDTLMSDTCALNVVSPHEVDFVEIYPSGNTPRATIRRNPFGLILIFRRRE